MDSKLKKWIEWLEIIESDVRELVISKHLLRETQNIIQNNSDIHISNIFYGYLGRSYISHVLMGVRRQVKIDKQSVSFARLLQEMIDNPHIVTREFYVGLYKDTSRNTSANSDFDKKFSEPGLPHIKASDVCDDLTKLRDLSKRCEDFADKRVAHRDKREPEEIPTHNELDACVELLDNLYCKYRLLFHASSLDTLMPTIINDWKKVFRVCWIPSKGD